MPSDNSATRYRFDQLVAIGLGTFLAISCVVFVADFTHTEAALTMAAIYTEPKWAALIVSAMLWAILVVFGVRLGIAETPRFGLADASIAALLLWLALSILWSPDRASAVSALPTIIATVVFYALGRLTRPAHLALILASAAVVAIVVTILLWILVPGGLGLHGGFGNVNHLAEFLVAAIPLSFVGYKIFRSRHWRTIALLTSVVGGVFLIGYLQTKLVFAAIFVIAAFWAFARHRNILSLACIVTGGVTFVAGSLFAVAFRDRYPVLADSFVDRLQNWIDALPLVLEHAISGIGIRGLFYAYPDNLNSYVDVWPGLGAPGASFVTAVPESLHNEPLDLLVSGGLIGFVLAVGMLATLMWRARRSDLGAASPAFYYGLSLSGLMGAALLGFPFQLPATLTFAALMAGGLVTASAETSGTHRGLPTVGFVLILVGIYPLHEKIVSSLAAMDSSRAALARERQDWPASYKLLTASISRDAANPVDRISQFTNLMVAGPAFWASLPEGSIKSSAQMARSASLHNPLFLDLRLKYLVSQPELDVEEAERLAAVFLRTTNHVAANAYVMEAAIALRLGQKNRARNALDAADSFPVVDSNDKTNEENAKRLRQTLESMPN
jgi:O-antigen ligase